MQGVEVYREIEKKSCEETYTYTMSNISVNYFFRIVPFSYTVHTEPGDKQSS